MKIFLLILLLILVPLYITSAQDDSFSIARLKYDGGGDWYNDPSAEENLLVFINQHTELKVNPKYVFADLSTDEIFSYPFLFMTGHGNITFSDSQSERLRTYLENGGFLYVDDDYGIDNSFRRELEKVFPEKSLVELPFDHDIYSIVFDFPQGPPKTHEHDNKAPQGFGLFLGERMVIYYTYESNPSDGWADAEVHNNPEDVREEALKFGTNIVMYALTR